jgi:signal-transduction protein with cAMP-binding, CBS, and nucleotidyltransferase domain/F0F1-type ATP synthase membrane subunit b/b'
MHLTPKDIRRFFAGIVFPSILAVVLFIISIYIFILPVIENNIMDKKREMISELVNTAWSLIEDYDQDYKDNFITLEEAQQLAINKIEKMRYGDENKDYFWITDLFPRMIMHPYRTELNGTELTNYKDQAGKLLFVVAIDTVINSGEGFIDYMWQWKDDSTRIVPKLSFVKIYHDWNWIIGTGIYLEDVKEEISALEKRLVKITFIIIGIIIVKQSLDIERRRKDVEDKLKASRRKYQSLVEASIDGTLLIIDDKIIFSNMKFNNMFGSSASYVLSLTYIIIVKDITKVKLVEKETEQLSNEIQTSLLLMNQPIKHFVKELIKCNIETSVHNVALTMTRKNQDVIFITQNDNIIGIVTDSDLRSRVLAKNIDPASSVAQIMTSPVISIQDNILLYEAVLIFNKKNISHLAVKNSKSEIIGILNNADAHKMQRNSISYLVREVEIAENVERIEKTTNKLPVLIKALIDSGARTQNITRIITSLTDAITNRVISLAIETLGPPPCKFAFIAVGSEGRMEQTLATDQDNAIIFDNIDKENHKVYKTYFLELGKKVTEALDRLGFKYCNGEVMANNPKWVLSLNEWKNQFKTWINNSDPKSILEAGIFFDFRCIYGDQQFTKDLQNYVFQAIENKAVFFQHMANPIIKYKSVVNLFGNIVGDSKDNDHSALDIKKIILPIVSFIRLYSLKYKITETNSILRLEKLNSENFISKSLYSEIIVSYNYLMLLRFRFQTNELLKKQTPDNLINIEELTDVEKTTIKKIISEISDLQTQLNFDFKGNL